MTSQAVGPGRRLAGRYRVEDLLDEVAGVRAWRAVDEVLRRPVFVQTLADDDERTAALARAARAAAVTVDSRFLRVLDVSAEDGVTYVVREWVPGRSLTTLLSAGPLPPEQAGALTREVASALASAHRQGLSHLRLEPSSVIVAPDGGVKVAGLATDAVVHGTTAGNPALADAEGLGRLLYAALTARWPGPGGFGLPPAPLVDGRVATPRQVRPGVPRALDDVTIRSLGAEGRHGPPFDSPEQVAAALSADGDGARQEALRAMGDDSVTDGTLPPALLSDEHDTADSLAPAAPRRARPEPTPAARPALRVLGVVAGLLLLVGATLVGLQLLVGGLDLGGQGDPGDSPGSTEEPAPGETPAEPQVREIVEAIDYDPPPGNGEESPRQVGQAIDGDPSTEWRTQTYFDPLELQKPGVGLVLDLGEPQRASQVRLTLVGETSDLEVRVAPEDADEPPDAADGWETVTTAEGAGTSVDLAFEQAVTTRYVLVWLTRLPPEGGDFRGGIAEAAVLG